MDNEKFLFPIPKKISEMTPQERRKFIEEFVEALREQYLKEQKESDS